jgi:hypothetical protein
MNAFQPLKSIEESQTTLSHFICMRCKLLVVLDRKPDAIGCDASLISHFNPFQLLVATSRASLD